MDYSSITLTQQGGWPKSFLICEGCGATIPAERRGDHDSHHEALDAFTLHVLKAQAQEIKELRAQHKAAIVAEAMDRSFDVTLTNRHRSVPPYDWFGPDLEPMPAGPGCVCRGCHARIDKLPKES